MFKAVVFCFLFASTISLAAQADAPPREIKVKGFAKIFLKATEFERITSDKELEKFIADADVRADIAKACDFTKENLVLFSWRGSGQDKITAVTGKDGVAEFEYRAGFTRDLRSHLKLFAIPAKAKIHVAPGK